jgi:hypothetical protein
MRFRHSDADFQARPEALAAGYDPNRVKFRQRIFLSNTSLPNSILQFSNPNLGPLNRGAHHFRPKVSLLDAERPEVAYLLPGIRHLEHFK